jgi:hypothetical protein
MRGRVSARTLPDGQEAVKPLINVPHRTEAGRGTAAPALIGDAARRQGGERGAGEEEGKEGEEEVVGRRDQAREQAPSPDALGVGIQVGRSVASLDLAGTPVCHYLKRPGLG